MAYRGPEAAPLSSIPAERRGRVLGRFCRVCGSVYPLWSAAHKGKPIHGKDHVSSPCAQEGEAFVDGASWWEPAVEVLPAPALAAAGWYRSRFTKPAVRSGVSPLRPAGPRGRSFSGKSTRPPRGWEWRSRQLAAPRLLGA